MARILRTAIIAAAPERLRLQVICALSAASIELLSAAENAADAVKDLQNLRPDLLVADAQLPGTEGARLVLHALRGFRLPVRPAAMLLRHPGCALPLEEALRAHGAMILEKPPENSAFARALNRLREAGYVFAPEETALADELLDALGMPRHIGRECLQTAALLCAADERFLQNLGGRLYPLLGEMCALNAAQAERAMRYAIGAAWQSDQFENQYRIFADTVDAGRGQPTCGEMISRLADILRSEG